MEGRWRRAAGGCSAAIAPLVSPYGLPSYQGTPMSPSKCSRGLRVPDRPNRWDGGKRRRSLVREVAAARRVARAVLAVASVARAPVAGTLALVMDSIAARPMLSTPLSA